MRLLVRSGSQLDAVAKGVGRPLEAAVQSGSVSATRLLLNSGAKVGGAEGLRSLARLAAKYKHEGIKKLLKKFQAKMEAKQDGRNPKAEKGEL